MNIFCFNIPTQHYFTTYSDTINRTLISLHNFITDNFFPNIDITVPAFSYTSYTILKNNKSSKYLVSANLLLYYLWYRIFLCLFWWNERNAKSKNHYISQINFLCTSLIANYNPNSSEHSLTVGRVMNNKINTGICGV